MPNLILNDKPAEIENPDLDTIIGCRFLKRQDPRDPDFYVPVTMRNTDKFLAFMMNGSESAAHSFYCTDADLLDQLQIRYPCKVPDATYLYELVDYDRKIKHKLNYPRRGRDYEWSEQSIDGYVVLRFPHLTACKSFEEFEQLSKDYGSFFIEGSLMRRLAYPLEPNCEQLDMRRVVVPRLEELGCTVTYVEKYSLYRVRYDPHGQQLKLYRQKLRVYEAATEVDWQDKPDNHFLFDLYCQLTRFSESPIDHLGDKQPWGIRGWGNIDRHHISVSDVLEVIALNRRLFTKSRWRWWRGNRRYYAARVSDYETIVRRNLVSIRPNLLAFLRPLRRVIGNRSIYQVYREYRKNFQPVEPNTKPLRFDVFARQQFEKAVIDLPELRELVQQYDWLPYHESYEPTHLANKLAEAVFDNYQLARFLRKEAKSLHMTLPAIPRKPVKPTKGGRRAKIIRQAKAASRL